MKKICLQSGHENARNNCDRKLQGSTGAPGEAEFNVRVRNMLSEILLSKTKDGKDAFGVQLVDATFNCDDTVGNIDYDLFLSIHYDADIYGVGGGFADFPEPNTDYSSEESQRIANIFNVEYPKHSDIAFVYRTNANTRYYYMWKFLSAKTPCVILECGVGQNAHDKVLLNDTERIANAIARSICVAFDVPFGDEPTPEPIEDWEEKYNLEVISHNETKSNAEKEKNEAINATIAEINEKIDNTQKDFTSTLTQ